MLHPLTGAIAQAHAAELRRQAAAGRAAEAAAGRNRRRATARTRSRLGFLLVETGLRLMSEPTAGTPE
jgi:hypothetical protein